MTKARSRIAPAAGRLATLALALFATCAAVSARAAPAEGLLRVCADPMNMPFSNEKGEGFENKLAEMMAGELTLPVAYTGFPQATGFIRQSLAANLRSMP